VLNENGFGCLTDRLASFWDVLGTMLFSLLEDTDDAENAALAQRKTQLPLTKSYICFILPF